MAEDKRPKFFYGYVVVSLAFLIMVTTHGTFFSFGVFFQPLLADFGWTRAVTAGAFSLNTVLHGFIYIFTGRLNDRVGPRVVITVCSFFLGLGYLLMSQVNSIWQLYLFYGLILSIGMGGMVPLLSTVSRWFVQRRGLMTGVVSAGIGVGTLIVPLAASWLISTYDWRASFMIMGVITMIVIVLAAQFLRRDPSQVGQYPYGETQMQTSGYIGEVSGFSLQRTTQTSQFWLLLVASILSGFCSHAITVHIVPHAIDLGISAVKAAGIISITGGVGAIGRIVMGGAGDRIGYRRAYAIGFLLMSIALVPLLFAKEIWLFYLFAAPFGFAYGGMSALAAPIIADLFGLRAHGVIMGSTSFGATVGAAIGPVLAGHFFDTTGSYQMAFLTCIGVSIVGFIVVSFLRPISRD